MYEGPLYYIDLFMQRGFKNFGFVGYALVVFNVYSNILTLNLKR